MWQKLVWSTIAIVFFGLLVHRVWRSAMLDRADHLPMPASSGNPAEQRELYLTPAGNYTLADIEANGNTTPAEKFHGFQARHDVNPRPGDRLCPVTRTKANRHCSWTIGGRVYQFCCPPCIDEFVRLAKREPDRILSPEDYVQR